MDFDFTTETITPDATNILTIAGTGGVEISVGTTGERPLLPVDGTIRYNTTDSKFEFYQNSVWINIGTSPLTTKGDLYTHNATVDARLPVGTSGYFLKANPATATGLEWVQNPALTLAEVDEEPTGFPNRVDSEILFDEGTRIFTIQPKSPATQFSVYQRGIEFIKTVAETITLPDTTALYFISYDTAGVLQSSTSKYDLSEQAPVSLVYWNATEGYATLLGEERHGLTMDWATHSYLHDTRGTQYVSGLTLGDFTIEGTGDDNTDAQMGILGGVIADEDIYLTIVNSLTPTLPFEQILSPLGEFPVLYRLGTGGIWYVDSATTYPIKMGTTYPTWNENIAGTWSTSEVVPNAYIAMFLLATNDIRHPIVAVMGQNESVSLPNAIRDNTFYSLDLGTIPFLEFRPLYRLIFEVKSNYNNDVKAALQDVTDIRLAPTIQIEQATATGTVTSVDVSGGTTGLTTTGGPITVAGTITLAGTLVLANGGTSASLTAVNGGVVYSTASAMAITAAGTAGQVLTSNGAAAPTWQPAVSALQLYKENPSTPTAPSATGTNAVAILSGSSASATNAIAIGAGTAADANNIFAYANGNFATAGDAQSIIVMLRRNTADAVASLMYVDGSSQLMVLPNNSAWTFNLRVVGRRTDATGTWAMYTFAGGITRDASAATTTLRGSSRSIIDESTGALNCTIAADTTNGSLNITVTGIAGQTIRWVATAEITQVTN